MEDNRTENAERTVAEHTVNVGVLISIELPDSRVIVLEKQEAFILLEKLKAVLGVRDSVLDSAWLSWRHEPVYYSRPDGSAIPSYLRPYGSEISTESVNEWATRSTLAGLNVARPDDVVSGLPRVGTSESGNRNNTGESSGISQADQAPDRIPRP